MDCPGSNLARMTDPADTLHSCIAASWAGGAARRQRKSVPSAPTPTSPPSRLARPPHLWVASASGSAAARSKGESSTDCKAPHCGERLNAASIMAADRKCQGLPPRGSQYFCRRGGARRGAVWQCTQARGEQRGGAWCWVRHRCSEAAGGWRPLARAMLALVVTPLWPGTARGEGGRGTAREGGPTHSRAGPRAW